MESSKANSNIKVVLVLGDGAIRAGFVAGAADRLLKLIPELSSKISLVYGVSASAGNAVYFSRFRDRHPGKEMWTELLADPAFISKQPIWSSKPVYDIDYMTNIIFRKKAPLPAANSQSDEDIGIVFPTLELGTGRVYYFTNKAGRSLVKHVRSGQIENIEGQDIYNLIGAASAAPFVYDRSFSINGINMIDAAPLAPSIDDLNLDGENIRFIYIFCRKPPNIITYIKYILSTLFFIVFILPLRSRKFPIINYWQYATKPFRMKAAFKNAFIRKNKGIASVIYPNNNLGDINDNSKNKLNENYNYGTRAAEMVVDEIKTMLKI